jgi:hypothetical protein
MAAAIAAGIVRPGAEAERPVPVHELLLRRGSRRGRGRRLDVAARPQKACPASAGDAAASDADLRGRCSSIRDAAASDAASDADGADCAGPRALAPLEFARTRLEPAGEPAGRHTTGTLPARTHARRARVGARGDRRTGPRGGPRCRGPCPASKFISKLIC